MWATMSEHGISLGDSGNQGIENVNVMSRLTFISARDLDEERDLAHMLVYNGAVVRVVDTFEASMGRGVS